MEQVIVEKVNQVCLHSVCSPHLSKGIEKCLPVEGLASHVASAVAASRRGEVSVQEAANEKRKLVINCFSSTLRPHHGFLKLWRLHSKSFGSCSDEM